MYTMRVAITAYVQQECIKQIAFTHCQYLFQTCIANAEQQRKI